MTYVPNNWQNLTISLSWNQQIKKSNYLGVRSGRRVRSPAGDSADDEIA